MTRTRRLYAALIILVAVAGHAETITWTNDAGGSFQVAENWDPNQVPDVADTAVFELTDGPYTVTWEGNITNHTHLVNDGTVTFDLQGHTYSLSQISTSRLGRASSTAILTVTNGIIQRLNATYMAALHNTLLYNISGSGSALILKNAKHENVAYYTTYNAGTRVLVDGPQARFEAFGGGNLYGTLIVTNGAYLAGGAGIGLRTGALLKIYGYGSSERALVCFGGTGMQAGSVFEMLDGAQVKNGYTTKFTVAGTLIFQEAHWYEHYGRLDTGWVTLSGVMQGTGQIEMSRIIMNGGTIRPGLANQVGLLSFTGHITNAVPTSVLDMEIGGPTTNDYDRIRLVAGTRGNGYLYAGGVLNVTALNNYEPERRTTFKLIDAVEIVPAFDTINLPEWDGIWDTEQLYTAGEITFISQRGTVIMIQ